MSAGRRSSPAARPGSARRSSTRLRGEGFEVESLDLDDRLRRHPTRRTGTPSGRSTSRASTRACSAGRATRPRSTLDGYRRAFAVNVDGVVLGVRRLATVMPEGGRIVCTASLAGLTAVPTTRSTRRRSTPWSASSAASRRRSPRGASRSTRSARGSRTRRCSPDATRQRLARRRLPAAHAGRRRRRGLGRARVRRDGPRVGRPAGPDRRSTSASRASPARAPRPTSRSARRPRLG